MVVQSVAESPTEEVLHQRLAELKGSRVWKTQPRLRSYIEHQWLSDNMCKVRSYCSIT